MENVGAEALLGPDIYEMRGILACGRHLIGTPFTQNLDVAILGERAASSFEHGRLGAFDIDFDEVELAGIVREVVVERDCMNLHRRRRVEPFSS